MRLFPLVIGASALFIAGCAAYFSVRGIALTFGAVSSFTVPIIIMASSLEIGKLVAASFLYRHWKTCNRSLRSYLLLAVALLICITSAGIYGYLSQAFEETLSQVEGYEKEIVSLQRQQGEFDRLVQAYQSSGQKGSALREERQGEERVRLEKYIEERRKDIASAEQSKARLAEETDQMILGERERREKEKKRLEEVIEIRREDIAKLEDSRKDAKVEVDQRISKELQKEESLNQRLAELDAAVKVYRDQGPGGFLKEDGFKKAAELLKTQAEEREGLRASLSEISQSVQKARDDLQKRHSSLDARIETIQNEILDANQKITALTTGGAEQADNVRTALENLQKARFSVDERIKSLESEIAEASKKITAMSEVSSAFGPDSSAELEQRKSELLAKKEQAERRILELQGKIRATDIGSFKFVARAFDSEVAAAEATENPHLIKEALDRAVNRVVKWFILILVAVFDPLAVTLVIAFNAAWMRRGGADGEDDPQGKVSGDEPKGSAANPIFVLIALGILIFAAYEILPDGNFSKKEKSASAKASLVGDFASRGMNERILSYLPEQAFGVCSFSNLRMVEEVGLSRIISDGLVQRVPFLKDMVWNPQACGIMADGKAGYFMQLPGPNHREQRAGDVLFGLILPIGDDERVKNFILSRLDLKSLRPNWKVRENEFPSFHSIHHHSSHVSVGLDENCLIFLTSWWTDQADPRFLDSEMQALFQNGQEPNHLQPGLVAKLRSEDFDVAVTLLGRNFFYPFEKSVEETEILGLFEDFLNFEVHLMAKAGVEGITVSGEYDYEKEVLDAGFGLRVASLMENARTGTNASGLSTVFGEFVEIFVQRLDFQSVVGTLERIDPEQSRGFEAFSNWRCADRIQASRTGSFSIQSDCEESGGAALRLLVDLFVEALNPFRGTSQ